MNYKMNGIKKKNRDTKQEPVPSEWQQFNSDGNYDFGGNGAKHGRYEGVTAQQKYS